jgi:hypothetical protein
MSGGLLVVAAVLAVLLGIFVYALMKVADDCDRVARYAEKQLIPYSDVTVTRAGGGSY